MKNLAKGSTWLSLLEQVITICPSLSLVLYYYFSQLEQTLSWSSKASFGLAFSVFIILMIYRAAFKKQVQAKRQSLIQSETDLRNGVGDPEKIATNIASDKIKLDTMDRAYYMIILLVIALVAYILEQAMLSLAMMISTALISVAAGAGVHIGVVKLKKSESLKAIKKEEGNGNN